MKDEELDEKFDQREDISEYLDVAQARRPALEQGRVKDLTTDC